jgi:Spy/CpxP family protein refolding chaperone
MVILNTQNYNIMNKLIFKIVLITGIVFGAGLMASAQQKGDCDRKRDGVEGEQKMKKENFSKNIPDMTDEQKDKMKELRISYMQSTLPLENERKEKKARLNTLSSTAQVDKKAMEKVIKEIGDLNTKLMLTKEFHKQDVRAILTDEQRVLFDSKGDHHKGRMGHGR